MHVENYALPPPLKKGRNFYPQGGLGIPIVTLLLEGGKDAIRIVKVGGVKSENRKICHTVQFHLQERLAEGIACVVIEGSGRAADIISYAYKNAVKNPAT